MQVSPRKEWLPSLIAAAVSAGLAAVLIIGCRVAFEAAYQTNDDIIIWMFAQGVGYTTEPSPYLIFPHYLYGKLLVLLYGWTNSINWYRVLAEGIRFISITTICFSVLRLELRLRTILLLTVYLLAFHLYFWRNPQWTATALLAGQAGVFLFFSQLRDNRHFPIAMAIPAILLIFLSTLIREQCAQLVLLLSIPLFFSQLIGRPKAATFAKVTLFMALAGTVSCLATSYNRWCYSRQEGWDQFHEFDSVRVKLNQFCRVPYNVETKPIYDRVGWSKNDYRMLLFWFLADPERYSIEKMRMILDAGRDHRSRTPLGAAQHTPKGPEPRASGSSGMPRPGRPDDSHTARKAVALASSHSLSWEPQLNRLLKNRDFLFMLCGIAVSLFYVRWDFPNLYCVGFLLLGVAEISGYLVLRMTLPPRVFFPMLAFFEITILSVAVGGRQGSARRSRFVWLKTIPVMAFAALVPFELHRHYTESMQFRVLNRRLLEAVDVLNPKPDQLFVIWGASFPRELISPDGNLDFMTSFKWVNVGYAAQTPVMQQRLVQFGITDVYRGLYEKDNVYLSADRGMLPLLFEYVREHYGVELTAKTVLDIPIGRYEGLPKGSYKGRFMRLTVFKLHPVKPKPSADPPASANSSTTSGRLRAGCSKRLHSPERLQMSSCGGIIRNRDQAES